MLKKKTSKKQDQSLKNTYRKKNKQPKINLNYHDIEFYSPTKKLLDEDFLGKAIWECFKNNDPEGVVEIIQAHLEAKHIMSKSTFKYPKLSTKNPSLKVLTQFIHSSFVSQSIKRHA